MKTVLIVGDSLTAGRAGARYVNYLARGKKPYRVIARGYGGNTLMGIRRRLPSLMDRHGPDIVVVAAGVNDVLLPWFKERGGPWKRLADRLEAFGSLPAEDVSAFQALYEETAALVENRSAAVVATTLTCLGEDVDGELNRRRGRLNDAIRRLAETRGLALADAGRAFDDVLRAASCPSAYLLNRYHRSISDTLFSFLGPGVALLSRKRKLVLTIDGVHLNHRGARLLAETIADSLRDLG